MDDPALVRDRTSVPSDPGVVASAVYKDGRRIADIPVGDASHRSRTAA